MNMRMIPAIVVVGLVSLAGVIVEMFGFGHGGSPDRAGGDEEPGEAVPRAIASAKGTGARTVARPKKAARMQPKRTVRAPEDADDMTPAEQALLDSIHDAQEDENFELTLSYAKKALLSSNQDLRQEAVDAIGWFDEKGLDTLVTLMNDANADIAESARDYVETALDNMDHADLAFAQAVIYLDEYGSNDETADMLVDVISFAGGQIVDPEDEDVPEDVAAARENRACIVEVVVSLIDAGGAMEKRGKEIYESISGEEWTDLDAADTWANDVGDDEPDDEPEEESGP